MKKYISIFISILLILVFASCSNNSTTSNSIIPESIESEPNAMSNTENITDKEKSEVVDSLKDFVEKSKLYDPFNFRLYFNNENLEGLLSMFTEGDEYKKISQSDHDLYVILGGYGDKGSEADKSYVQFFTYKDLFEPFEIRYMDYYLKYSDCIAQFNLLIEHLSNDYGSCENILFVTSEAESETTLKDIQNDMLSIKDNSGYYYVDWPTEDILYYIAIDYPTEDAAYRLNFGMLPAIK